MQIPTTSNTVVAYFQNFSFVLSATNFNNVLEILITNSQIIVCSPKIWDWDAQNNVINKIYGILNVNENKQLTKQYFDESLMWDFLTKKVSIDSYEKEISSPFQLVTLDNFCVAFMWMNNIGLATKEECVLFEKTCYGLTYETNEPRKLKKYEIYLNAGFFASYTGLNLDYIQSLIYDDSGDWVKAFIESTKNNTIDKERKKRNQKQYVYCFEDKSEQGYLKFGFSTNPGQRLLSINTASPLSLDILGYVEGSLKDELELHKLLKQDKYRKSEWYQKNESEKVKLAYKWFKNTKKKMTKRD